MSKELPYFKFYVAEWLLGDITLESMEIQGTFINVCATYWSKDCRVAIDALKNKYGEPIAKLLASSLIKEKEGFAVISFLDEQWKELSKYHQKNIENGIKGAEKRWGKNSEANGEPIALRKDNIIKDNIYNDFISSINKATGRNFKGEQKSKKQFNARISEGYTLPQIELAIKTCFSDPYHQQNKHYLTPEFITRADKLQKYCIEISDLTAPRTDKMNPGDYDKLMTT